MRLTVALAVILTISVTAQEQGENQKQDLLVNDTKRRITKRDAAVIIEDFPLDLARDRKQKIIYRRITKQRYRSPKVKYRPPARYGLLSTKQPALRQAPPFKLASPKPKYGPPFHSKKKNSEHVKRLQTKYKKRQPRPKHPKNPRNNIKSKYGPAHKTKYSFSQQEPAGFGEPPPEAPQPTHGEPPVDSYGAPLNPSVAQIYPTAQGALETSSFYDNKHYNSAQQSNLHGPSWQTDTPKHIVDNNYAPSKNAPAIELPESGSFNELKSFFSDNHNLDTYSEIFQYNPSKVNVNPVRKGKPTYSSDKMINNAWKSSNANRDHVIVGGQYAEPPARYLPRFPTSAEIFGDEHADVASSTNAFEQSEVASWATVSPYVNYKNTNMAFSPQNLNDAFGIVDK